MQPAVLKKQDKKNFRKNGAGQNRAADDKEQTVRALEFGQITQCLSNRYVRVKRDRQREHDRLNDERWFRVCPGCLPTDRERRSGCWHRRKPQRSAEAAFTTARWRSDL